MVGISYVQFTGAQQALNSSEELSGAQGFHSVPKVITGTVRDQLLPEVLLQLQVRNSDGQLLAYIEGTKIEQPRPLLLNQYLDDKPNKKIITKEGKAFELIQWQARTETFQKVHSMAMFQLKVPVDNEYRNALMINHEAYQIQPGDTVTVYWTIIRPAP